MKRNTKLRAIAGTVAGLVAAGAFAAPAHAGILTTSATDCNDGALTQPFARYGDTAQYKSVGTFEAGRVDAVRDEEGAGGGPGSAER